MTLSRWSKYLVPTLAFVTLASACRSSTGPIEGGINGTFIARTVNGNALPATAYKAAGDEFILIADTLRFSVDGTVKRSMAFRRIIVGLASADNVFTHHLTLIYSRTGDRLFIGPKCPPNADCVPGEFADFKQSTIELAGSVFWGGNAVIKFEQTALLE